MVVAASQPMSLSKEEAAKEEIEELLHSSPRQYGVSRSRWRLTDIGAVVPWLKQCTEAGISQILKRLGIRMKQAISFVRSPDPEYVVKRRRMLHLFGAAIYHPDENVMLFQDELTYYSQPEPTPLFAPVGQDSPYLSRTAGENKMTRIGAVMNGFTGQVNYLQRDKFGKEAMADLYRQIRRLYPDRRLFVVQDNCNFHYSDNVLATADRLDIQPVFLPTYASWLNPIEKLWRWLKADVLHGHDFAHDYRLLRQVVAEFLDQFANGSRSLLRYTGLLPV